MPFDSDLMVLGLFGFLVGLFFLYTLAVILRAKLDKRKFMYKLIVQFPSLEEVQRRRYAEIMTGFFNQIGGFLVGDRLSFEIHKTGEHVFLMLTISNPDLVVTLKGYLTAIEGIAIKEVDKNYEPLNIYKHETPYINRLVLENDYFVLNSFKSDFVQKTVDYLSSLPKDESGGVVCILRPARKSIYKKIEREIQKRDELARVDVNSTNLTVEKESLKEKLGTNLFQVEFYTIGTEKMITRSLSSNFEILGGIKNKFLVKPKLKGTLELIKKRYIAKPHLFNSISRKIFLGNYLNAYELAGIFHPAPIQRGGYESQEIRVLEAKPEFLNSMPDNVLIGRSILKTGQKTDVYFPLKNLERHVYLAGKTGMGKSTVLTLLYLSLAEKTRDKALVMLDPHDQTLQEIAFRLPDWHNVIYFNLAENQKRVMTINPLFSFKESIKEKENKIDQIIAIFQEESEDRSTTLGTTTEKVIRFLIESAVHFPDAYFKYLMEKMGKTRKEALKLVYEKQITLPDLGQVVKSTTNYKQVFQRVFEGYDFEIGFKWEKQLDEYMIKNRNVADGIDNRLSFVSKGSLIPILEGNKFNIVDLIAQKKRVLFPVTEQSFGSSNKKLVARILLSQIWGSTQFITRAEYRKEVVLFADEFQTIQLNLIDDLLAQARKYKVRLVLGNQYLGQLKTEIKESILGNVSTLFSFTAGNASEAREIRPAFGDKVEVSEIMNLPNYTAYMRTLGGSNQETAFLSFETMDYKGNIPEKHDFNELMKLNDWCLEAYGEDVEELRKRHLAKLENAEKYFLDDV